MVFLSTTFLHIILFICDLISYICRYKFEKDTHSLQESKLITSQSGFFAIDRLKKNRKKNEKIKSTTMLLILCAFTLGLFCEPSDIYKIALKAKVYCKRSILQERNKNETSDTKWENEDSPTATEWVHESTKTDEYVKKIKKIYI